MVIRGSWTCAVPVGFASSVVDAMAQFLEDMELTKMDEGRVDEGWLYQRNDKTRRINPESIS
jgi:hypothetical protein